MKRSATHGAKRSAKQSAKRGKQGKQGARRSPPDVTKEALASLLRKVGVPVVGLMGSTDPQDSPVVAAVRAIIKNGVHAQRLSNRARKSTLVGKDYVVKGPYTRGRALVLNLGLTALMHALHARTTLPLECVVKEAVETADETEGDEVAETYRYYLVWRNVGDYSPDTDLLPTESSGINAKRKVLPRGSFVHRVSDLRLAVRSEKAGGGDAEDGGDGGDRATGGSVGDDKDDGPPCFTERIVMDTLTHLYWRAVLGVGDSGPHNVLVRRDVPDSVVGVDMEELRSWAVLATNDAWMHLAPRISREAAAFYTPFARRLKLALFLPVSFVILCSELHILFPTMFRTLEWLSRRLRKVNSDLQRRFGIAQDVPDAPLPAYADPVVPVVPVMMPLPPSPVGDPRPKGKVTGDGVGGKGDGVGGGPHRPSPVFVPPTHTDRVMTRGWGRASRTPTPPTPSFYVLPPPPMLSSLFHMSSSIPHPLEPVFG